MRANKKEIDKHCFCEGQMEKLVERDIEGERKTDKERKIRTDQVSMSHTAPSCSPACPGCV